MLRLCLWAKSLPAKQARPTIGTICGSLVIRRNAPCGQARATIAFSLERTWCQEMARSRKRLPAGASQTRLQVGFRSEHNSRIRAAASPRTRTRTRRRKEEEATGEPPRLRSIVEAPQEALLAKRREAPREALLAKKNAGRHTGGAAGETPGGTTGGAAGETPGGTTGGGTTAPDPGSSSTPGSGTAGGSSGTDTTG